ncbi:MAG: hypothetical protein ACRDP2_03495 [Nocardioidaceae bacterium]
MTSTTGREDLSMIPTTDTTLLEEARSVAAGATNAYYNGNQHVFEEAAKLATTLALVDIAESLRALRPERPQHNPNRPW